MVDGLILIFLTGGSIAFFSFISFLFITLLSFSSAFSTALLSRTIFFRILIFSLSFSLLFPFSFLMSFICSLCSFNLFASNTLSLSFSILMPLFFSLLLSSSFFLSSASILSRESSEPSSIFKYFFFNLPLLKHLLLFDPTDFSDTRLGFFFFSTRAFFTSFLALVSLSSLPSEL